jgi:hypothetical protein
VPTKKRCSSSKFVTTLHRPAILWRGDGTRFNDLKGTDGSRLWQQLQQAITLATNVLSKLSRGRTKHDGPGCARDQRVCHQKTLKASIKIRYHAYTTFFLQCRPTIQRFERHLRSPFRKKLQWVIVSATKFSSKNIVGLSASEHSIAPQNLTEAQHRGYENSQPAWKTHGLHGQRFSADVTLPEAPHLFPPYWANCLYLITAVLNSVIRSAVLSEFQNSPQ